MIGLVDDLLEALAGGPAGGLADAAESNRRRHRDERFGRGLIDIAERDPGAADDLLRRLDALPPENVGRIVDAPALWTAVTITSCHPAALTSQLDGWLRAEERLVTAANAGGELQWTALGDYRTGCGAAAELLGRSTDAGTLVDGRSPYATNPLPEVAGQPGELTDDELDTALRHLDAAEARLAATGPPRLALVASMTRVVVVRRDREARGFNSASTKLAARQSVLRNPDDAAITTGLMADALLHEAVHSLLDLLELAEPFAAASPHTGATFISPWSGASLDADTFVQACLIWFALVHLSLDALRVGAGPEDQARAGLERSIRGFLGPDLIGADTPGRCQLSPVARALVGEAQSRVRRL